MARMMADRYVYELIGSLRKSHPYIAENKGAIKPAKDKNVAVYERNKKL